MDHLRTRIGLLEVVGHGHRVKLADRIVAREDAARVFPGDGRAGLHLRPRQAGVFAADAALGHEIIDAAPPLLVAGIPVLHRGVFDLGVLLDDDLDHGGMQLVLVAARGRTAFEVAHVSPFVGHDQRTFELSRPSRIDTEIGRQFHRTADTPGDVAERTVGEDRGIERRIEIVGIGDDAAQVFLHQVGEVAQRLGDRTEDDALFGQHLLERRLDRHRVHHGVDRHARQRHLLFEGDAQFVERAFELRVDLVHRIEFFLRLGGGVIDDVLKIYFGNRQVRPRRGFQRQPVAVSRHAPLGHPRGLAFLGGDQTYHLLVQTLTDGFGLDVRGEAVLVFLLSYILQYVFIFLCHYERNITQRYKI